MRILSFNLWHGMAPRDGWRFEALEPSFRREKRFDLQNEILKATKADVLLLQEVNPVEGRAPSLAKELGCKVFSKSDISGLKLAGYGWPYNLHSGLVTLINPDLLPRELGPIKLSGPRLNFTGRLASIQFAECRYALPVEFVTHLGARVLVVNFHLHHRLEFTAELEKALHALVEDGVMTGAAVSDLKSRLDEGNQRRANEWRVFSEWLDPRRNVFDLILLGGDFNLTPKSQVYAEIAKAGFIDLGLAGNDSEAHATFDHSRNEANHFFTRQFPLGYEFEDLSFSPKVRERLKELLMVHEGRPRRIDYIWMGGPLSQNLKGSLQQLGVPGSESELAPSDHFGLLADLPALK